MPNKCLSNVCGYLCAITVFSIVFIGLFDDTFKIVLLSILLVFGFTYVIKSCLVELEDECFYENLEQQSEEAYEYSNSNPIIANSTANEAEPTIAETNVTVHSSRVIHNVMPNLNTQTVIQSSFVVTEQNITKDEDLPPLYDDVVDDNFLPKYEDIIAIEEDIE